LLRLAIRFSLVSYSLKLLLFKYNIVVASNKNTTIEHQNSVTASQSYIIKRREGQIIFVLLKVNNLNIKFYENIRRKTYNYYRTRKW